mmetsp:Transcript_22711/g.49745  ORF Transcript_22711/g.49745 Transcript_22711/m.49745 type:complete len:331 (-) Transcript_22711:41-1033(-)
MDATGAGGEEAVKTYTFRANQQNYTLTSSQLSRYPGSTLNALIKDVDFRSEGTAIAMPRSSPLFPFIHQLYMTGSMAEAARALPEEYSLQRLREELDYYQLPTSYLLSEAALKVPGISPDVGSGDQGSALLGLPSGIALPAHLMRLVGMLAEVMLVERTVDQANKLLMQKALDNPTADSHSLMARQRQATLFFSTSHNKHMLEPFMLIPEFPISAASPSATPTATVCPTPSATVCPTASASVSWPHFPYQMVGMDKNRFWISDSASTYMRLIGPDSATFYTAALAGVAASFTASGYKVSWEVVDIPGPSIDPESERDWSLWPVSCLVLKW